MFFWILGLIAVFALGLCYGVFSSQRDRVLSATERVRESLWSRQAKMPLLLSLTAALSEAQKELFAQLFAMRSVLSDEHMALTSRIENEKKLGSYIAQLQAKAQQHPEISHNYTFIALTKEFSVCDVAINSAIREYNYQLDRFVSMHRFPWFSAWSVFAKIEEKAPLSGV